MNSSVCRCVVCFSVATYGNDPQAHSYARSKAKNPRSKIGRFRSGKIVFVPRTKAILCEIEKSAGF